jgi:hypothetical protein
VVTIAVGRGSASPGTVPGMRAEWEYLGDSCRSNLSTVLRIEEVFLPRVGERLVGWLVGCILRPWFTA